MTAAPGFEPTRRQEHAPETDEEREKRVKAMAIRSIDNEINECRREYNRLEKLNTNDAAIRMGREQRHIAMLGRWIDSLYTNKPQAKDFREPGEEG